MIAAFGTGLALGLGLIAAIGAQNAFVLRQGLLRRHVLAVVLTCALSDAVLIAAGVGGFGLMVDRVPGLAAVLLWGGVAFLLVYGGRAFLQAWRGGASLAPGAVLDQSLGVAVATCLAFTWLNPHVYLDTVVLIGSVAARWPGQGLAFGAGAVTASFVFFFSLGYGARLLTPLFQRPQAWRVLDTLIGIIMWTIALQLVLHRAA